VARLQERYDIFMNNFTERTWTLVKEISGSDQFTNWGVYIDEAGGVWQSVGLLSLTYPGAADPAGETPERR
jgi:hypothetical protein